QDALADEPRRRDGRDGQDEQDPTRATHVRAPKRPFGRTSTPTRNRRWAYSGPALGSKRSPTSSATPSTMPPTIAPHNEPRPPSTTTSNAINRRSTPEYGVNDARIASSMPATLASASARPITTL